MCSKRCRRLWGDCRGEQAGRGEAAGVYYLGDDQHHMLETIEQIRGAIEGGMTREDLQVVLPPCGARNALDCALWELEAKLSEFRCGSSRASRDQNLW